MINRKPAVAAVSAALFALTGLTLAGCDRDRADNAANPSATRTASNATKGSNSTNGTSVTPNANTSAPSPSTTGTTSETQVSPATSGMPSPALTAKVKSSLLADPAVSGLRIDVDTSGGAVTLNGSVKSQAEADRAVQLATATEGVTSVKSNLSVTR